MVLEGSGAVLGSSWAPLGRLLDAVGQLLGSLERFLGTSGLVWDASWADFGSRGSIFEGLGLPGEGFGASKTLFFRTIVLAWPNKCIHCCRKPILAIASAFRSLLKRGGTCAAHGIIDFGGSPDCIVTVLVCTKERLP